MVGKLIRAFVISPYICLAACGSVEQENLQPLASAQLRLKHADREKLDVNVQAEDYLAAARIAEQELNSTGPESNHSSAVGIYNRASAGLASDIPALVHAQNNRQILVLTDSKTGRTERLRVKSGSRGEYDPSYFQQILLADRVNQKWLQEHAERQGLGGAVVGVHWGSGSFVSRSGFWSPFRRLLSRPWLLTTILESFALRPASKGSLQRTRFSFHSINFR
jgi:hypothetical protein